MHEHGAGSLLLLLLLLSLSLHGQGFGQSRIALMRIVSWPSLVENGRTRLPGATQALHMFSCTIARGTVISSCHVSAQATRRWSLYATFFEKIDEFDSSRRHTALSDKASTAVSADDSQPL